MQPGMGCKPARPGRRRQRGRQRARRRETDIAAQALARAQMTTLRCKLLKVGTVVVRNTRRIRFFISSGFPYRDTFLLVARRFATG